MSTREGWYPGARVERLRSSHSYRFVLVLVLVTFLWAAAAPEEPWARSFLLILLAGVLTAAAWTAGLGRLALYVSGALIAAAVVLSILADQSGRAVTGTIFLFAAALVLTAIGVIAIGVFDQRAVNAQAVMGGISAYVLLGLLFTCVYSAIAGIGAGPLFAQGTDGTLSLRLYYSYVTLATVGYGDYTTSGDLGHTISVFEALAGQLYLVTVVATLVGRFRPRAAS